MTMCPDGQDLGEGGMTKYQRAEGRNDQNSTHRAHYESSYRELDYVH
jgi:hypothetical protein